MSIYLRPSLSASLAIALGAAFGAPSPANMIVPKAAASQPLYHRHFPGGLLGGFLPGHHAPRYRSKPRTTVKREQRKATKRRNQLRHKARCRA